MSTIRWQPVTSHLDNDTPGTLVLGSPGSGKTFFMLNMCANALGMGQRVIIIDPKNDFDKLLNVNPNIKVINFRDIKQGQLNPLEFLKRIDPKTKEIEYLEPGSLLTIIEIMTGTIPDEAKVVIAGIVEDFVNDVARNGKYVDMSDVAQYLTKNPNTAVQNVGTTLKMHKKSKFGKLMFTDMDYVEPLQLSLTDSMVLILDCLELPSSDTKPEDYTQEQRFTAAILYVLTKKLFEILRQDSVIPTVFVCDEAHLLFSNNDMSKVIDDFLRLGRSLNTATVLASQGISSFPKSIYNAISTKFLFKSSINEAQAFFEAFDTASLGGSNIAVNSIIAAAIKFPTGTCFMMDRKHRNGIIRIISNYDHNLLTSNPLDKIRKDGEGE